MSHPDHARWQQSWRERNIDFHLAQVHPLLTRFWSQLGLAATDRVFVPLCGKSRDLMWLHDQGHDVTGVELSPVAVRAFFKESRLQPRRTRSGAFTRWEQERLRIYCGDFFALAASDLLGVKALYDRASLTALPEDLRESYVAHLLAILPDDCRYLLLTVEDLDDDETEAAANTLSGEIGALYGKHFDIDLRHAACSPALLTAEGGISEPRSTHKAYVIRRKTLI